MDTLALLCNLHADGPETLQRLRSAGWDTLREIQAVDLIELEVVLDADKGRAVRFKREASLLRERLGLDLDPVTTDGTLEQDSAATEKARTTTAPEIPKRSAAPEKSKTHHPAVAASPESRVRRPFAVARLGHRGSLATEQQRNSEVGELESVNESAIAHGAHCIEGSELELPAREMLIPHPAAPETATLKLPVSPEPPNPEWERAAQTRRNRLEPGAVDGLDREACARLEQAGVTTLEELSQAAGLELAAASGVDFTTLLRLSFLARRELQSQPSKPENAPRSEDSLDSTRFIPLKPTERMPPPDPDGDVAGPFA